MTLKSNIQEFIHKFILYSSHSKMSKKSIGFLVRTIHASSPIIYMILVLFAPHIIAFITIVFSIFIFFLFYMFDGCMLSKIENALCEDKFTIIDPYLEMLDIPVTKKNIFFATKLFMVLYFIAILSVYYIRFSLKRGSVNIQTNISF